MDLITEAKKNGTRVWAETCPQYLILTDDVYAGEDRHLYVMNPPLRGEKDRERLWRAVLAGEIDTIGTDHCSYMREQKKRGFRFDQIPPGLPGVETLLPVIFSEGVAKNGMPLSRLVELLCLNPARIFGLHPRKGEITVGGDGDLVIFNPDLEWTISSGDLHTNSDFCPFEGMRVNGRVEKTILRGEIVYDGKRFCGTPNGGRFIEGRRC
jgi:dihydropyrimidinase